MIKQISKLYLIVISLKYFIYQVLVEINLHIALLFCIKNGLKYADLELDIRSEF